MSYRDLSDGYSRLSSYASPTHHHDFAINIPAITTPTPVWFETYLSLLPAFEKALAQIQTLRSLHQQSLRMQFNTSEQRRVRDSCDTLEQDLQAHILQLRKKQVTLLTETEQQLRRSQVVQRQVLLAVSRGLYRRLTHVVSEFQKEQSSYRASLEKQMAMTTDSTSHKDRALQDDNKGDADMLLDTSSPEVQEAARVQQRHQEIVQLSRKVADLLVMSIQLNRMVLEQGSMLDRIDAHIIQARESTHKANKELVQATHYTHHNGRVWLGCCGFMSLLCFILFILFVWRHS